MKINPGTKVPKLNKIKQLLEVKEMLNQILRMNPTMLTNLN
jgi:hypothetical protein